jgi:hypothetical protein
MTLMEVNKCISNLNEELADMTEASEFFHFTMKTDGNTIIIEFLGCQLWNNDDDEREYDEFADTYEPLEPFLRRRVGVLIENIRKIVEKKWKKE